MTSDFASVRTFSTASRNPLHQKEPCFPLHDAKSFLPFVECDCLLVSVAIRFVFPSSISVLSSKPRESNAAHQMAKDYKNLVGNMMHSTTNLPQLHNGLHGRYSHYLYHPHHPHHEFHHQFLYPIEHITSLGVLMSPLQCLSDIEKWSPYEISTMERGIHVKGVPCPGCTETPLC